jgi:predicted Zn-ribbon and HTH transcriptional regulator
MRTISKTGKITSFKQGRFECLDCGTIDRLPAELNIYSRCTNCSSYFISPKPDLALVPATSALPTGDQC